MADKRLIDFQVNDLPTGDDIIYFGKQSDSFRETRTTLNQERGFTPQYVRQSDENVTQIYMGKNVINGPATPITVTIPQGAAFPVSSQFNMIRNGTGAFTLTAAAGVTLNGVDGGSITLAQQYDRLVATEILADEWTFVEYSGAVGASTLQDAYNNAVDGNINLTVGKPFVQSSAVAGSRLPSMTEAEFKAIATPLNGESAWDETSDKIIVNKGTSVSPDYDHLAYVSQIPVPTVPSYGEVYFQGNETETEIVTQSSGVKINATYSSEILSNFTHNAGRLTYSGDTKTFSVNISSSITLDKLSDSVKVFIYKNGVIIDKAGMTSFIGPVSPGDHSVSSQCLIELSATDYIEVFIENISSTNNIIVTNLNCIVNDVESSNGSAPSENGVFSQITSAGVFNTLAEETTIGSIVGTKTISGGTISLGQSYEIVQTGSISTATGTTPTLTFRVKLNGILIAQTQPTLVPDVTGLSGYTLRVDNMVFRAVGALGVVTADGSFNFLSTIDATQSVQTSLRFINTTINTNIDNTIEITAQWNALSVNNDLISESTTMVRKY